MKFIDIRHTNYHMIYERGPEKWSTNWQKFPGFPIAFNFEYAWRLAGDNAHQWMKDNWHYSVYISVIYILIVLLLKNYMRNRVKPYELRTPLTLWSSGLALFSIAGTLRCLPEFVHILATKGFEASFCDGSYYEDTRLTLWYWLFVISKAVELGDTIFIILRKKRMLSLHWIHHVLTLCYSWLVFGDVPATARWMVNMNFAIHSLMYSYYALKAMQLRVPQSVAMFITLTQIGQMCFGLVINSRVVQFKLTGVACDASASVAVAGVALYGLFFVLFLNFFIKSYFKLTPIRSKHKPKPINCNNNNNNNSGDHESGHNNVEKKTK